MEPKKFVKGKHQHTSFGHGVKEIRSTQVPGEAPAQGLQLEIGIDEGTARGRYANLASVAHTDSEFILDFLFLQPGQGRAKVHTRILSSPLHAKRLLAALADNLQRYEARFGPVGGSPPPRA
jgi:hypothetical protein